MDAHDHDERRPAALGDAGSSGRDVLVACDASGRIVLAGPGIEALLGWPAEELAGRPLATILPSGWRDAENAQARRRDGVDVPVEVTTAELGPTRLLLLHDARNRLALQAVLEGLPDATVAAGADGRIVFVNALAEELFGYSGEELVGRPIEVLWPERQRDRYTRNMELYFTTEHPLRFSAEARGLRKDGTEFVGEMSWGIVETDEGPLLLAIGRDISERRAAEVRLRRQSEQQAAVAALGERALSGAALPEVSSEAVERIRASLAVARVVVTSRSGSEQLAAWDEDVAGGIAHDFNNLLTVISGYGAIAQKRIGVGPGAEELEEIAHATDRAAQVTRQLLAFSRRQVLEPTVLDLNEVARGLAPMLGRLIDEDVAIAMLTDEGLAPVVADRGQLAQVILNLAVNARDAMPTGGTLTIETRMLADGQVGLIVSDTGVGMEPTVLEHAFEPFFTTKEAGHGTGLGLATVHGIVQQSGGRISVRSEPGFGATFTVSLPPAEPAARASRESAEDRSAPLAGTETVLLCEDDDSVRRLIEQVLTAHGHRVLVAALPSEALRLAAKHLDSIDVLVSDVVMPEMPGPELAARLQAMRPGLRTLFVSGYTAEALRTRGGLPEWSAFVEKPFEAATLLRTLRGLLDQNTRTP